MTEGRETRYRVRKEQYARRRQSPPRRTGREEQAADPVAGRGSRRGPLGAHLSPGRPASPALSTASNLEGVPGEVRGRLRRARRSAPGRSEVAREVKLRRSRRPGHTSIQEVAGPEREARNRRPGPRYQPRPPPPPRRRALTGDDGLVLHGVDHRRQRLLKGVHGRPASPARPRAPWAARGRAGRPKPERRRSRHSDVRPAALSSSRPAAPPPPPPRHGASTSGAGAAGTASGARSLKGEAFPPCRRSPQRNGSWGCATIGGALLCAWGEAPVASRPWAAVESLLGPCRRGWTAESRHPTPAPSGRRDWLGRGRPNSPPWSARDHRPRPAHARARRRGPTFGGR